MESKLNIIPAIFRKAFFNSDKTQTMKFLIVLIIIAATLAFIHGSIKENMLSATSIVVIVITFFVTYFFIKKSYSRKIFRMKRIIKKMKYPTVMDNICEDDSFNNQCVKYNDAKKDFFKISNLLLQQYKFNK